MILGVWNKIKKIFKRPMLLSLLLLGAAVIFWAGYLRFIMGIPWSSWTGFEAYTIPKSDQFDYVPAKNLWDFLQLLFIPLILFIGGLWFNAQQNKRERDIEKDRQCEASLQTYFDKMAKLMLEDELLNKAEVEGDPTVVIAQIRTTTTLRSLDQTRRNTLCQFIRDANLATFILKGASLSGADLSGTDLTWMDMERTNLINTNLRRSNMGISQYSFGDEPTLRELTGNNLKYANLSGADLTEADLRVADLTETVLEHAILRRAKLFLVRFNNANLNNADLTDADLTDADLTDADLTDADLTNALVHTDHLRKAKSLKGATMPDGSIHE